MNRDELINQLVETEMNEFCHDDSPKDYGNKLAFYLSNAERDSYIDYIKSIYNATTEDATEIQTQVIAEIKRRYEAIQLSASIAGKKGGSVKSEAKARASRENGKLGGRPRKEDMNIKKLKNWLEKQYGKTEKTEIVYEGKTYTGYMYGNDECYDCGRFYQYFLTNNTLYKAFYEIPDGETDLGNLDYDNPIDLIDADAQYFIDYV